MTSPLSEEEVRKVFDLFDKDQSGDIDRAEFQELAYACGLVLSNQELDRILASVDTDKSGKIEFNEFLAWYKTAPGDDGEEEDAQKVLLRASLFAQYGMRMSGNLMDSVEITDEAEKAQGQYSQVKFGVHAGPKNEEKSKTSVRFSLLPPSEASQLFGEAAPGDKQVALFLKLKTSEATDKAKTAEGLNAKLNGLPLPPFIIAKSVRVEGEEIAIQVTLELDQAKAAKADKLLKLAQLKGLSISLEFSPAMGEAASAEDLSLDIRVEGSLPRPLLAIAKAAVAQKLNRETKGDTPPSTEAEQAKSGRPRKTPFRPPGPAALVGLIEKLSGASLELNFDSLADLLSAVTEDDENSPLKQFTEQGGWPFVSTLPQTKMPLKMAPPDVKALLADLTGASLTVGVGKELSFVLDFENLNPGKLLPELTQ